MLHTARYCDVYQYVWSQQQTQQEVTTHHVPKAARRGITVHVDVVRFILHI